MSRIITSPVFAGLLANAGAAGGGKLIDDVGIAAAICCGMRKLKDSYSGNWAELRRDSDGATANFGFAVDGKYNKAAVTTWVGGSIARLKTWYSNDGGIDLVQTDEARMPTLDLSADEFVFDGTNDWLVSSANINASATNKVSFYCVGRQDATTGHKIFLEHTPDYGSGNGFTIFDFTTYLEAGMQQGGNYNLKYVASDTDEHLMFAVVDRSLSGSSQVLFRVDGVAGIDDTAVTNTGNFTSDLLYVGGSTGNVRCLTGKIKEVGVFLQALTSGESTKLESNVNTHYAIY